MNKIIIFIIISIFSISNVFANNLPYDFESINYIPIKLSITKPIATDEDIQEGQEVCDTCKQEYGISSEGESDEDINNWHRYISDDDDGEDDIDDEMEED